MCWSFVEDSLHTRTYYGPELEVQPWEAETSRFWGFFLLNTTFYATYCGVLDSFHSLYLLSSFHVDTLPTILTFLSFTLHLFSLFRASYFHPDSVISSLNFSYSPFILILKFCLLFYIYYLCFMLFYFHIFITFLISSFYTTPISGLSVLISSFISSVLG